MKAAVRGAVMAMRTEGSAALRNRLYTSAGSGLPAGAPCSSEPSSTNMDLMVGQAALRASKDHRPEAPPTSGLLPELEDRAAHPSNLEAEVVDPSADGCTRAE